MSFLPSTAACVSTRVVSWKLAALMKLPVTFVFTHDSLMVGEDGPTHQPVEHVAALRLIPNLNVYRPADVIETEVVPVLPLLSELALEDRVAGDFASIGGGSRNLIEPTAQWSVIGGGLANSIRLNAVCRY